MPLDLTEQPHPTVGSDGDEFAAALEAVLDQLEENDQSLRTDFEAAFDGLFGSGVLYNSFTPPLIDDNGLTVVVAPHTSFNGFAYTLAEEHVVPLPDNSTRWVWERQDSDDTNYRFELTATSTPPTAGLLGFILLGKVETSGGAVTAISSTPGEVYETVYPYSGVPTLQDVTDAGAITTDAISTGAITSSGVVQGTGLKATGLTNQATVGTDADGDLVAGPANVNTGTGTTNTIPKKTASTTLGDSTITDDGSTVTVGAALVANSLNLGGATVTDLLTATASINPASIAATGGANQAAHTVTVTGAATGDAVIATPASGIEVGLTWVAYVSAANTVTVLITNVSTAPIDPANRSWRIVVIKF